MGLWPWPTFRAKEEEEEKRIEEEKAGYARLCMRGLHGLMTSLTSHELFEEDEACLPLQNLWSCRYMVAHQ